MPIRLRRPYTADAVIPYACGDDIHRAGAVMKKALFPKTKALMPDLSKLLHATCYRWNCGTLFNPRE